MKPAKANENNVNLMKDNILTIDNSGSLDKKVFIIKYKKKINKKKKYLFLKNPQLLLLKKKNKIIVVSKIFINAGPIIIAIGRMLKSIVKKLSIIKSFFILLVFIKFYFNSLYLVKLLNRYLIIFKY
jgi:hypothetical protein